jgi:hypothetical protein
MEEYDKREQNDHNKTKAAFIVTLKSEDLLSLCDKGSNYYQVT